MKYYYSVIAVLIFNFISQGAVANKESSVSKLNQSEYEHQVEGEDIYPSLH